jgi:hypothetical protein
MEREGVNIGERPAKADDDLPASVLPMRLDVPLQPRPQGGLRSLWD